LIEQESFGFVCIFFQYIFIFPCTKDCILLYRTIDSFVQKKTIFCTRR